MIEPEFITAVEASKMLCVSLRTFNGKVQYHKKAPKPIRFCEKGKRYYRRADIVRFKAEL